MIKHTLWRPDTCGCVVVYQWDTDAPDAPPVAVAHPKTQMCPHHASLTPDVHLERLLDENTLKNTAVALAAKELGLTDEEAHAQVQWAMDGGRNLVVTLPPSASAQATVQAQLAISGEVLKRNTGRGVSVQKR